jgi:hypothetical protein
MDAPRDAAPAPGQPPPAQQQQQALLESRRQLKRALFLIERELGMRPRPTEPHRDER